MAISASKQKNIGTTSEKYLLDFTTALCDDLNTAKALAVVWELYNDTNIEDQNKWATLLKFDTVLGLNLQQTVKFEISTDAQSLVTKRDVARANKDFALSDTLRSELEALGYVVLDTPEGTVLS